MSKQLGFDYDVFISYSSQNKEWVHGELLKRIEKAGLRAFIDFRDFKRGAPSIKEMERGVSTSRKTLLVLTPDYIESEWCELENIMAQILSPANRDLRLIPLLKTQCKKPLHIGALTYIDFTDGADFGLAWHQLLTALDAPLEQAAEKAIPTGVQSELDNAKAVTDAEKFFEAIPILEKALAAADQSGHAVARVKVRLSLARALYEAREDFSGAELHYRNALALVPIDNFDLKHNILEGLGNMLLVAGQLDEAKATIHTALDIAKRTRNADDSSGLLISLCGIERDLGFHDSAAAKIDEAVFLLLQQGLSLPEDEKKHHAHNLAICYTNKALLCLDVGNLDEALTFFGKAEEQHRISGSRLNAGKALLFFGDTHCATANWEKGLDCYRRALGSFKEAGNLLWSARGLERISRVCMTHGRWKEALEMMLSATAMAEESGHIGEQVHFLCLSAKLFRNWKKKTGRDSVARTIHELAKNIPEEKKAEIMSALSTKSREMYDALEKAIREDDEVCDLVKQAKDIAQREGLHGHLANCLLDEAHNMTPPDDTIARRNLIAQAIELLKEELQKAQSPKRRGHLMVQISGLYWKLSERSEALSWLKKAGEIFRKSGNALGLANYHASQADIHLAEGRIDDQIAEYRKVLSVIEGRSFHALAARTQINLASALRSRREFSEAQKLLNEAEFLCDQHHLNDLTKVIAQIRGNIEQELQAAQAPTSTLPELLDSLDQLLKYRPEHAVAYLPFWYFAWKTELLALVRSGPGLSFMVVTDDVARFMRFAAKFKHLADYFLMTTSHPGKVKVEAKILPIPPSWLLPVTFPLLLMKSDTLKSASKEKEARQDEDAPLNIRLDGPATMLPPYIPVDAKSNVPEEWHMMALSTPHLPQEAIDLMIGWPAKELIQRHAVWFPTTRSISKDPFLDDLLTGHEREVFPVYFDRVPNSDAVAVCGGVQITIANTLLSADSLPIGARWKRALLKLTKLPKEEAQVALLDIPELFTYNNEQGINSTQIEIRLFEFGQIGQRLFHPVLLIRGE